MTSLDRDVARTVADAVAEALASPCGARALGLRQGWWPQSLAVGAAGVALLHIERAHAGLGSWQRAHEWLDCAAHDGVHTGADAHLHYGAPALAFVLHAAIGEQSRYARALETLDHHIAIATRRRLDAAHARMDGGAPPALAEFDAIRGLTGIGAYLRHRNANAPLLAEILAYLVRLTEPIDDHGEPLPGWWTNLGPSGRPSRNFPGGHANTGMAHGIAGPLALLALTLKDGLTVDGHIEAIERICTWLDRWRQDDGNAPWWPYWITHAQLCGDQPLPAKPSRPSWCYGTAGVARAQQLAARAINDDARREMAERALAGAFTDSEQRAAIIDSSLCHGHAGLLQIASRCAADARTLMVRHMTPLLHAVVRDPDPERVAAELLQPPHGCFGFLEGAAGVALALHSAASGSPPASGWDSCLLIA
ncbi:lanthionine synthetase C family protein [Actinomadura sp. WAC 06369]|uniref:lanthionine synthetase C family protein n=1 Tax=Actinomadura sp. WAC 06369 TaxID=2203193 RepID=UPI000F789B26|nr:lanthionine synthetase C family protein [Actinomadura sp. WAC 06369]RSN56606.1 Lanthionine biosynthesis cyclase LanC [Actinomadura sp. WAC 06369]